MTRGEEKKIRQIAEEITKLAKRSTSPEFTDIVAKILKKFAAEIKEPLIAAINLKYEQQQPRDPSRVVLPGDDDYWAVKAEEALRPSIRPGERPKKRKK